LEKCSGKKRKAALKSILTSQNIQFKHAKIPIGKGEKKLSKLRITQLKLEFYHCIQEVKTVIPSNIGAND